MLGRIYKKTFDPGKCKRIKIKGRKHCDETTMSNTIESLSKVKTDDITIKTGMQVKVKIFREIKERSFTLESSSGVMLIGEKKRAFV